MGEVGRGRWRNRWVRWGGEGKRNRWVRWGGEGKRNRWVRWGGEGKRTDGRKEEAEGGGGREEGKGENLHTQARTR